MKYDVLRMSLVFSWVFYRLVVVQSQECSSTDPGSCSTSLNDILKVTGSRELEMHRSNLTIEDGSLHVVGKDDQDHNLVTIESKTSGKFQATIVEIQGSKSVMNYDVFKVMILDQCLFNIKQDGAVNIEQNGLFVTGDKGIEITKGGMHIAKGGLVLGEFQNQNAPTSNDEQGIQILDGNLSLDKGNLVLKNGQGSITRSAPDLQSLLSLTLSSATTSAKSPPPNSPSSSVLHVHGNSTTSRSQEDQLYLLTAGRDESTNPLFSIHSSGQVQIERGGLDVRAGGIHVATGGQTIASGGLTIESGGLDIQGGRLRSRDGFDITHGGLSVTNDATAASVLSLRSSNPNFSGTTLLLTTDSSSTSAHGSLALESRNAEGKTTSSLRPEGELYLASNLKCDGDVVVRGDFVTRGRVILSSTQVEASDEIHVPTSHALVQILDDGHVRRNILSFVVSTRGASTPAGQTLVIQNQDSDPLSFPGHADIPPSSGLVSLIFDGTTWQPVGSTATAPVQQSQSQSSSSDLANHPHSPSKMQPTTTTPSQDNNNQVQFGPVTLSARDVQVASQTRGHVAYYGRGGKLTGSDALSFRDGIVDVPILRPEEIIGRVNASHAELVNVRLLGGSLHDVTVESVSIVNHGDLTVKSQAFVGGGLTVNGLVMGSGAYVDISDLRFKRNITSLSNSVDQLFSLEGVAYDLRVDEFPAYRFSRQRQFGFIADDVAKVLPELITEDARGYKRMAYSRLIPLVVEALKEEKDRSVITRETLVQAQASITRLERQVTLLTDKVETLGQANSVLVRIFLCVTTIGDSLTTSCR